MKLFYLLVAIFVWDSCQAKRELLQAVSGTCVVQPNSNAQGDVLETTSALNEGDCCDKCLKKTGCNTFVYCPARRGCTNQGRPSQVLPYQLCDLKFQPQVENPTYWFTGLETDFTSGFVTIESGLVLESVAQIEQPIARSLILQDILAEDSSSADKCMLVSNANAQGDLVDDKLRVGLNSAECCQQCQEHPQCNVFVYCPRIEGCINQGRVEVTLEHTRCDLKYQEVVAGGSDPEYWFTGPNTDFASGYILGKQKGLSPALAPAPAPAPVIVQDPEDLPVISTPVVDFKPVPSPTIGRASSAPLPSTFNNRVAA